MKTSRESLLGSEPRGDRSPGTASKGRFFRCSLRQGLLLVALVGILLAILRPRIHQTFNGWRHQQAANKRDAATAELTAAVRTGDVARARQALQAGAESNYGSDQGRSPFLLESIARGHLEMIGLLLEYGADVSGRSNGPHPLFAAARCDQSPEVRSKMVRLLIAAGADPRAKEASLNLMDIAFRVSDGQLGDLLREYGLPYGPREMAAFNRLDELKRAVEESPAILQERFKPTWAAWPGHGPTLLAIALERAYRELALFLIEAGSPLDTQVYFGQTLLHMAARGGDPELVRLLVARGLDVHATDRYGDTPLSDLAGRDKPEAVAALLEAESDANHRGANGRTSLHHAAFVGSVDLAQMLLAAGADPLIADDKGQTPLDVARTRSPPVAQLLEQAIAKKPATEK